MKENVLDVLIYLFENYMLEVDEYEPNQQTLVLELSLAGFDSTLINDAFDWLENLAVSCHNQTEGNNTNKGAVRYYVDEELKLLNLEARGLLLSLEQCGVLDATTREVVIERLMALGIPNVELDHFKWVILMVLSSYTNGEGVSELIETLVLEGLNTRIH